MQLFKGEQLISFKNTIYRKFLNTVLDKSVWGFQFSVCLWMVRGNESLSYAKWLGKVFGSFWFKFMWQCQSVIFKGNQISTCCPKINGLLLLMSFCLWLGWSSGNLLGCMLQLKHISYQLKWCCMVPEEWWICSPVGFVKCLGVSQ